MKGQETMGKQDSTTTGKNKRTERAKSLNVVYGVTKTLVDRRVSAFQVTNTTSFSRQN
jgi:hypothetical protein